MGSGDLSIVTTYLMGDGLVSDHHLLEPGQSARNHKMRHVCLWRRILELLKPLSWYRTMSHV